MFLASTFSKTKSARQFGKELPAKPSETSYLQKTLAVLYEFFDTIDIILSR